VSLRHKYYAKPTITQGIKFGSTQEARYYENLLLRVKAGEVVVFLRQVPFYLPGRVVYRCDFEEFHADGSVHFTDVKGWNEKKQEFYLTKEFIRNKKIVEDVYRPIEIEVVR